MRISHTLDYTFYDFRDSCIGWFHVAMLFAMNAYICIQSVSALVAYSSSYSIAAKAQCIVVMVNSIVSLILTSHVCPFPDATVLIAILLNLATIVVRAVATGLGMNPARLGVEDHFTYTAISAFIIITFVLWLLFIQFEIEFNATAVKNIILRRKARNQTITQDENELNQVKITAPLTRTDSSASGAPPPAYREDSGLPEYA